MPPEINPQPVCPVHDESFKRLEQLIESKFDSARKRWSGRTWATRPRRTPGSPSCSTGWNRCKSNRRNVSKRLLRPGVNRRACGVLKTQEEHEGRIKVIERGYWKLAGGLGPACPAGQYRRKRDPETHPII